MTPIPEPDYTVKETMMRLNTSRQTVYDLIKAGELYSYTSAIVILNQTKQTVAIRRGPYTSIQDIQIVQMG